MVIWPNKLLCLSSSTVSTTGVKSCSVDLYQIRPVSQATKFAERSERVEYNKITWQFYKERCFWIGQTLFFLMYNTYMTLFTICMLKLRVFHSMVGLTFKGVLGQKCWVSI